MRRAITFLLASLLLIMSVAGPAFAWDPKAGGEAIAWEADYYQRDLSYTVYDVYHDASGVWHADEVYTDSWTESLSGSDSDTTTLPPAEDGYHWEQSSSGPTDTRLFNTNLSDARMNETNYPNDGRYTVDTVYDRAWVTQYTYHQVEDSTSDPIDQQSVICSTIK